MSDPDGPAPAASVSPVQESPAQKMDQMYRWTRHVYDLTRRYYLLGRDQLLSRIADRPAGRVLEVGCGTARNLRRLHHQAPRHSLYGLDVSRAMLATARRALRRMGCARAVTLRLGRAESWRPDDPFGGTAFDVIFFSYALSMIPAWPTALRTALTHLRPGGGSTSWTFGIRRAFRAGWRGSCRGGSPCLMCPRGVRSSPGSVPSMIGAGLPVPYGP
jgi:Methylase involved in ubiquinone/menaquinone biosynthesis